MNHSYFESRSKEKINDLMKEGMMSQAYYRSRSSKARFLSRFSKFILIVLMLLGLIQLFL